MKERQQERGGWSLLGGKIGFLKITSWLFKIRDLSKFVFSALQKDGMNSIGIVLFAISPLFCRW